VVRSRGVLVVGLMAGCAEPVRAQTMKAMATWADHSARNSLTAKTSRQVTGGLPGAGLTVRRERVTGWPVIWGWSLGKLGMLAVVHGAASNCTNSGCWLDCLTCRKRGRREGLRHDHFRRSHSALSGGCRPGLPPGRPPGVAREVPGYAFAGHGGCPLCWGSPRRRAPRVHGGGSRHAPIV
jgi:hypothetical protein